QRCHDRCSHRKVRYEMAVHDVNVDAIRPRPLRLGDLRAEPGEIRGENGWSELHLLPSKVSTNSRYRRTISLTACSRVICLARHATSGSQKLVRPTAKPMNPGTAAAVVSQS